MLPYLQFIPAFQSWCAADPTHDAAASYCASHLRIDQALCLLPTLWPIFVEVQGLILRQKTGSDTWDAYLEAARQAHWDDTTIEYVANHLHMSDLFLNDPDRDQIDRAAFVVLATIIAEMWQAKLRVQYPDKHFRIGVTDAEDDPDVEVYVYTDRGD